MKLYVSTFLIFGMMAAIITPALAQNASTEDGQKASLAIDQRDGNQYGWAVNFTTQAEADEYALNECEKNSGECHTVLWFTGGCGAYVVERGNSRLYGWGTADTRAAAESRAMKEAQARGGQDLVVRVWGCNGGELVDNEEVSPSVKGVYLYHFIYAEREERCFVMNVLYQPGVAQKQGDVWTWTDGAEERMTPMADHYMDAVEENLYGYLGDMKDEVYTRTSLDWAGINEIDINNSAINLSNRERQERFEKGRQSYQKFCSDKGYEIVQVDVR